MSVIKPNGKTRDLKGERTFKEYMWQVVSIIVVDWAGCGRWSVYFRTKAGFCFIGSCDDREKLWDWLHSRRTLQGCPLSWDTRILHVCFDKVGNYPE